MIDYAFVSADHLSSTVLDIQLTSLRHIACVILGKVLHRSIYKMLCISIIFSLYCTPEIMGTGRIYFPPKFSTLFMTLHWNDMVYFERYT